MFLTIITNIEALKMPVKTKNFDPDSDKKLLCTCNHSDCDKRSVKQSLLNRLQLVRDDVLRGLTVTSGGRCPNHPNEIKRTTPADHQKGVGVDIAVSGGVERAQLVMLGIKHGFNAIGVAKTFVHLGYREGEQPVIWTY
jgi:hypothetical protein